MTTRRGAKCLSIKELNARAQVDIDDSYSIKYYIRAAQNVLSQVSAWNLIDVCFRGLLAKSLLPLHYPTFLGRIGRNRTNKKSISFF